MTGNVEQSSDPKKPGCFAIGCGVLMCAFAFSFLMKLAAASGGPGPAPIKQFVVIDRLPDDDPECVTIRARKKTLGRIAVESGWPAPGGMGGDNATGYYEVVTHKPPWPCELRQAWLKDPIQPGTALEIKSADAVSATVTGAIGETRTLMLNYHNSSRDGDLDPRRVGNEKPLLGYHIATVPWDPARSMPACIRPWSSLGIIGWPPKSGILLFLLFGFILCLKVLDCIGKDRFVWMWSLLLYIALFVPMHLAVSAYAESRTNCDPAAVAFALNVPHTGGTIYPFPAGALSGPWVADSSIVVASQICVFVALVLAARLIFPAAVGLHYLLVPHPAEQAIRRQPGRPAEIDTPTLDKKLNRGNITAESLVRVAPPEFVLRNQRRRVRNVTDLLREETKLAEAAVEHQRAVRPTQKEPADDERKRPKG